ncbi:MAG: hypothetical protein LBQ37_02400 [Elusimicrobiota bacterium]|jgi:flagellar hook-basal body complex protein FliE|nr:hypothetical protein [Elusimicrobiota bacterium]
MKKYAMDIDAETKECRSVGVGTDKEFYKKLGMKEMEVEQAFDGKYYLKGYAPQPSTEYLNNETKMKRQAAYSAEADLIKLDLDEQKEVYDAMVESGSAKKELTAQKKVVDNLRSQWLASKNEIRKRHPYVSDIKENGDEDADA